MNALNRLGTVLSAVFLVCLVALVAEILYVLWRRRRFQRPTVTSSVADVDFSSDSPSTTPSSKELLYFFCWKSQTTRVEPDSITATAAMPAPRLPAEMTDAEVEEMLKLQGMYGPSRVLFTIKEEEREEMEGTENDVSSMETELVKRKTTCFAEVDAAVSDVVVEIDEEIPTPFWTPCSSPQHYYTPSPSPSRDLKSLFSCGGTENGVILGVSGEDMV